MGCSAGVMRCGRSVYEGRPRGGGGRSMPGAGRGASVRVRAARAVRLSCGLKGLLAELPQRVEAALEQLAGDGQAGAVAAQPRGGRDVVVVVRRGRFRSATRSTSTSRECRTATP